MYQDKLHKLGIQFKERFNLDVSIEHTRTVREDMNGASLPSSPEPTENDLRIMEHHISIFTHNLR